MKGADSAAELSGRMLGSRYTCHPDQPASLTRAISASRPTTQHPLPRSCSLHATPQAVLEAITSFPHGSAGRTRRSAASTPEGPAGWGAGECWIGERGWRDEWGVVPGRLANPLLLEAITDLVNLPAVGGDAAVRVRASLVSRAPSRRLRRKRGGVRLIAVGYTWLVVAGGEGGVSVCVRASRLCQPLPGAEAALALGSRWHGSGMSHACHDGMSRTCRRVTCL